MSADKEKTAIKIEVKCKSLFSTKYMKKYQPFFFQALFCEIYDIIPVYKAPLFCCLLSYDLDQNSQIWKIRTVGPQIVQTAIQVGLMDYILVS